LCGVTHLTNLSHQANSGDWQQTLTIHPNNNRGTETQQSTSNFDANGNLLVLNNIGSQISLSSDFLGHELKKYLLPNLAWPQPTHQNQATWVFYFWVIQKQYPELTPRKITKLMDSRENALLDLYI
jgi:hypothetical protein